MKHLACGLVSCLLLPFLFFLPTASSSAEVTFSWVTIGDAGNACDPQVGFPCVGGLPYTYRISRFEVTNLQYAEFLNAVASEFDTFGIYDPQMGALPHGGIDRASQGGGFVYSVKTGFESRPVTYVSLQISAAELPASAYQRAIHIQLGGRAVAKGVGQHDMVPI